MNVPLERFARCEDCPVAYEADDPALVAEAARLHRRESGHTVWESVRPVIR